MRGNRTRQSDYQIPTHRFRSAVNYYAQENRASQYLGRAASRMCNYCQSYHHNQSEKCYFTCLYCHSIHFKKKMFGQSKFEMTICPLLKDYALKQQNKKAFDCDSCGGIGSYQKIIQTKFAQPDLAFRKRIVEYQKLKLQGKTQLEAPRRKIFRNTHQSRNEQCFSCIGKGKVYKMIQCCQIGCNQCAFTRIKVNKEWKQIRAKGEDNDQVFPCRICSKEVQVGDKIFKMQCGHTFHRGCIFSWLNVKQGCYTCSQVDPSLAGYEFPRQHLNQQQLIGLILANNEQLMLKATLNKLDNLTSHKSKGDKKSKELIMQKFNRKIDFDQSSYIKGQSSILSCKQSSQRSYLSMKRTNSIIETQNQQRDNDSLMIVRVPSQEEERELNLDLSVIIRKQSQEINQQLAENIQSYYAENFLQELSFKNQIKQNAQLVIKQINQFQEERHIQ